MCVFASTTLSSSGATWELLAPKSQRATITRGRKGKTLSPKSAKLGSHSHPDRTNVLPNRGPLLNPPVRFPG